MPVFINEVTTEVEQAVVPATESNASESRMPVTPPEFEFLQTLTLVEERRQRLEYD
jgi:hypothetical protein